MNSLEVRRKIALGICPELGEEINELKRKRKRDKSEIEILKMGIANRQALIDTFISDIGRERNEEEMLRFLAETMGEEHLEDLEATLSDPNGKIVFK